MRERLLRLVYRGSGRWGIGWALRRRPLVFLRAYAIGYCDAQDFGPNPLAAAFGCLHPSPRVNRAYRAGESLAAASGGGGDDA